MHYWPPKALKKIEKLLCSFGNGAQKDPKVQPSNANNKYERLQREQKSAHTESGKIMDKRKVLCCERKKEEKRKKLGKKWKKRRKYWQQATQWQRDPHTQTPKSA